MGQVNDLERIGRDVESSDIDSSLRSRIELTMRRPAEMPIIEKKAEVRLEVPPHLSLDDHGDVIAQPATDVVTEAEPEPAPVIVEEAAPLAVAEPIAEPEQKTEISTPAADAHHHEAVETPAPLHQVTRMPQFVPGGLLAMGLGVYALDIYVISAGILTGALAWGVSILASLLMVYAVIRFLPMITRGKKNTEHEAVLCPVCHEMVSDRDSKCPSCGVRFRETPSRE